jgi:hypothetical protein
MSGSHKIGNTFEQAAVLGSIREDLRVKLQELSDSPNASFKSRTDLVGYCALNFGISSSWVEPFIVRRKLRGAQVVDLPPQQTTNLFGKNTTKAPLERIVANEFDKDGLELALGEFAAALEITNDQVESKKVDIIYPANGFAMEYWGRTIARLGPLQKIDQEIAAVNVSADIVSIRNDNRHLRSVIIMGEDSGNNFVINSMH